MALVSDSRVDAAQTPRTMVHAPLRPGRSSSSRLPGRVRLVCDIASLGAAWAMALLLMGSARTNGESLLLFAVALVAGDRLLRAQGLHKARISSVRIVEMTRLVRLSLLTPIVVVAAALMLDVDAGPAAFVVGGALQLALFLLTRSWYRAWMAGRRAAGQHIRPTIIVGTNSEAASIVELTSVHPELGIQVTGVIGDRVEAVGNRLERLYLGPLGSLADALDSTRSSGAIIAVSSLVPDELTESVRVCLSADVYVNVTSGLSGIDTRRLKSQLIGYEPFMHVQPARLGRWQSMAKRAFDIVASGIGMLLVAPLVGALALAVKLQDRGPAFFGQERVGLQGEPFKIWKLRTMVVDAEARLAALKASTNERTDVLFKMENDPRFTRLGRFLDLTSINELPQLWNVFRGDMSLVGPRPALASEVEQFDAEFRARASVRPGITGLWQVEARDNPSFSAYRRLDLFYVENWSVLFDLVIIFSTFEAVVTKVIRRILRPVRGGEPDPSHDATMGDGPGTSMAGPSDSRTLREAG